MALIDGDAVTELAADLRWSGADIDEVASAASVVLYSIGREDLAATANARLTDASDTMTKVASDLDTRVAIAWRIEQTFRNIPFASGPFVITGAPPRPTPQPPETLNANVVRVHQLFALAGLLNPDTQALLDELAGDEPVPPQYLISEWMWTNHPDLAQQRMEIAHQLEEAFQRRDELAAAQLPTEGPPSTYDWIAATRIADELAELDNEIERLTDAWIVDHDTIDRFLEPLTHQQRDALLGLVMLTTTAVGVQPPPEFQAYIDAELARIRAEWAVAVYIGGGETDPVQQYMDHVVYGEHADLLAPARTRELGDIIETLDPHQPDAVAAFLDGLFLGDLVDTEYRGGSAFAHLAGQILSGELIFGDVRDVIAALNNSDFGGAALAGIGFIPFAGALRHADEVHDTLRAVRRATRAFRRGDGSGSYIRTVGITNSGQRLATEVLDEVGREGFTRVALHNGIDALATVMTRDELTDTLLELRRLEPERLDLIRAIDHELVQPGLTPQMRSLMESAKESLANHLKPDDLLGGLRDANGVPVYEVVDAAGTLRVVQHDTEVINALISVENLERALPGNRPFHVTGLSDTLGDLEILIGVRPRA